MINIQREIKKLTSLIIPCFNQLNYTKQCVNSILKYTDAPFELVFINNGSTDDTGKYLNALAQRDERVRVINNHENLGCAPAINQGFHAAGGDYLLPLNNDVIVTENWLSRMVAVGEANNEIGIIGPRSNSVPGVQLISNIPYKNEKEMQSFAGKLADENAGRGFYAARVIGFCMLVKKEVVERIGGFDLRYRIGNFDDDDFCLRALIAGYKIWVCKDVFIHHFGRITFSSIDISYHRIMAENWQKFKEKWGIPNDRTMKSGYYPDPIIKQPFNPELHYCPLVNS